MNRRFFDNVNIVISKRLLNCTVFNARSLCNKLTELQHLLYSGSFDVVLITETWLSDRIPDALLDPRNLFTIVRCDRGSSAHGGVCALVAKPSGIIQVASLKNCADIEACSFDLLIGKSKIRLVNVYRAPSSSSMSSLIDYLNVCTAVNYHCIITGDFNCSNINWVSLSAPNDGTQNEFVDFAVTRSFKQMVHEPTRGNNILDLVLSNEPIAVANLSVEPPFGSSDHCQVEFSIFIDNEKCDTAKQNVNSKCYNWHKADYQGMSDYLDTVDWFGMLTTNLTPDSLWHAFDTVLRAAVDAFVPVRRPDDRIKNQPWYPAALRQVIGRRRCLWRQKKKHPNDAAICAAYDKAGKKYKDLLNRYEIKREQRVIESNNIGSFYRFVNSKLSCRHGVGALTNDKGEVITDDSERANLLNSYFSSVCTVDDGTVPIANRVVPADVNLHSVEFTPENVYAAIRKLKHGGASGPDGYPPSLFKNLASCISKPLSLIFTSFMSVGQIPSHWSHAIVTPIYKSGPTSRVSNYRPISLTAVASKLMERVIVADLLLYLRQHGVISRQQHGFLAGRSTSSNLLETINDWTLAVNDKKSVTAAYVDFAKAFDTVCQNKLLLKLQAYGIAGPLFNWIQSFLSNRTQQTRIGSSLSAVTKLTSGVVQGSVIGPLLFVLFINDIAQLLQTSSSTCVCKLYADDLKLYSTIETDADYDLLQNGLNLICSWSNTWQLKISYAKCNVMFIGNGSSATNLLLDNYVLPVVNTVKDLGVVIDSRLTFDAHIQQMVAKAFSRANLIHKCFMSRDTTTLLRAFVVYVRPLLEYASSVWSPYHVGQIRSIENVQRKFTKRLPGLTNMEYRDRLLRLGIDSLEIRRLRQDLIYTYKVVFGLVDRACDSFFKLANTVHSAHTRGHLYKLYPHYCRIDIRKHFFAERVVSVWNNLPAEESHFRNLTVFKYFIRRIDLNQFTNCH